MKPSIFIGSSKEALKLARAVKTVLAKKFHADIWDENIFDIGEDSLNSLLRFLQCYDYAVFVLRDDDQVISRGKTSAAPRDNVIFELGLFMGALSRRRTFPIIVETETGSPKIPSDLLGNNAVYLPAKFASAKKIPPIALGKHLAHLVATMQERARQSTLRLLPSTALAIGYFQNFLLPVCRELAARTTIQINGAEHNVGHGNFDFTVVLPTTLRDASGEGARKFARAHGAHEFVLKTSLRAYPFYTKAVAPEKNGRVTFYDYPTALLASQEAIRLALAGPYLGYGKYQDTLEKKEIGNFARTLDILLRENSAADFRDNIKIAYAPKKTEGREKKTARK